MLSAVEPQDPEDRLVRRFAERYLPARGWSDVLVVAEAGHDWAGFLRERGYDVTMTSPDADALDAALDAAYSAVFCPARALMDSPEPCRLAARLAGALHPDGHLVARALIDDSCTARYPCLAPGRLGLGPADAGQWGGAGAFRTRR